MPIFLQTVSWPDKLTKLHMVSKGEKCIYINVLKFLTEVKEKIPHEPKLA